MAQKMLSEANMPNYFWAEAINIICYILNRDLERASLKNTPCEL